MWQKSVFWSFKQDITSTHAQKTSNQHKTHVCLYSLLLLLIQLYHYNIGKSKKSAIAENCKFKIHLLALPHRLIGSNIFGNLKTSPVILTYHRSSSVLFDYPNYYNLYFGNFKWLISLKFCIYKLFDFLFTVILLIKIVPSCAGAFLINFSFDFVLFTSCLPFGNTKRRRSGVYVSTAASYIFFNTFFYKNTNCIQLISTLFLSKHCIYTLI